MANKSIILISIIFVMVSSLAYADSVTSELGAITSASACNSGWKCQLPYFMAYRSSTCSWSDREYCLFGCSVGKCIIKPIKIVGDSDCVLKTNQALTLLKKEARVHYNVVTKSVGVIKCVDKGFGIYVGINPPKYVVGKATINAGTIWYASTIVHDACHSKQYHDYRVDHPYATVPLKIYTGKNAEALCLNAQYDALVKIGANQIILDHIKNIINSEYWEIPKKDRWW
ncbi:hypothetical protein J4427_03010 [Candidatus Woesearchaeota archaeon]|nr:hypothetical protein [Candidatus Woesearchaeota archaeon]